jgi:hypothetical protein
MKEPRITGVRWVRMIFADSRHAKERNVVWIVGDHEGHVRELLSHVALWAERDIYCSPARKLGRELAISVRNAREGVDQPKRRRFQIVVGKIQHHTEYDGGRSELRGRKYHEDGGECGLQHPPTFSEMVRLARVKGRDFLLELGERDGWIDNLRCGS